MPANIPANMDPFGCISTRNPPDKSIVQALFQPGKIQLSQGFKQHDVGGVREVEGPQAGFLAHGYADGPIFSGFDEVTGKSGSFFSKKKHVLVVEIGFRVELFTFGGGEPHPAVSVFFKEILQAFVYLQIHVRPVIKAGPAETLFVQAEAKGFDQMKHTAGCSSSAGDVAGVRRDLRFDEYDVKGHLQPPFLWNKIQN